MYCTNCGKKIVEDAKYCTNCGNKIDKNSNVQIILNEISNLYNNLKKIVDKNIKSVKILLTIIVLIVFIVFINVFFFSEDAIIRKYTVAYALNDYKTLVNLSDGNESEFVSSSVIKNKYGESEVKPVSVNILSSNKSFKEHTRTVSYTVNNKTQILSLKVKKTLFGYKIISSNLFANNIKITIPSNYKIKVDNVFLTDKYKDSSTKDTITYKIDSILKKDVCFSIITDKGITFTDTKSVFNNEDIDYTKLNYSEIDDKTSKKINDIINNLITSIVISNNYNEINNDYFVDKNMLLDSYNLFKEKYNSSYVSKFEITNIELLNIKIGDNTFDTKYCITYEYLDSDKEKHEKTRNINITFTDDLKIKEFYLNSLMYMF